LARRGLLPTPTATDAKGSRNATATRKPGSTHHSGTTLTDALLLGLLPTPTATDAKNATLPPSQAARDSVPGHLLRTGVVGSLHPRFVEWMMGFPPGWTDLDDDDRETTGTD
jgi:hypothetical protein